MDGEEIIVVSDVYGLLVMITTLIAFCSTYDYGH